MSALPPKADIRSAAPGGRFRFSYRPIRKPRRGFYSLNVHYFYIINHEATRPKILNSNVNGLVDASRQTSPAPPSELTDAQAQVWRDVVASRDAQVGIIEPV
jgi:hypothetical protein